MNYLAIKDLKAPKLVRETLAEYGTALVTNNGKPMALLVDLLEGESPEFGLHVPIVMGNPKHFPARAIGDISVLSPAAFLAQLSR